MKKRIFTGILSAVLLSAVLIGCGSRDTETTPPSETQTQPADNEVTEAVTDPVVEITEPTDPNVVVVSTPYGNLQYQDQWVEFMKTEQLQEGDALIVSFYSEINETRYPLFDLVIGNAEDGAAAQITDAAGVQRDVNVRMHEIVESEALADNELNRLHAMQEEINYIIENIK